MRKCVALSYSLKIMRRKSTAVILMMLCCAFYWMFCGTAVLIGLCVKMSEPAVLKCVVTDGQKTLFSELGQMNNIRYVTAFRQSKQTMVFGDYSADVVLTGYEQGYLYNMYGAQITVSMDGAMPYIILDSSVLEAMKNHKNKAMDVGMLQSHLMERVVFDSGQEARICCITDAQESPEGESDVLMVYTTLEGYETIVSGTGGIGDAAVDGSDTGAVMQNRSAGHILSGSTEQMERMEYRVVLSSGFSLKKVTGWLGSRGITAKFQNNEDLSEEWAEEMRQGKQWIFLAIPVFICALMLAAYQKRLWMLEHEAFVSYMNMMDTSGRTMKKIFAYAVWIYLLVGGVCGGVAALLNESFQFY